MKKEIVEKILKETEIGYDLISEKFSQTRNRFWGGLEFIEKYAKENSKILDFGCGNGRLSSILKNKNIDYIGTDVSGELINFAKNNHADDAGFKNIQFLKLDYNFKKLPFTNNFFNAIYTIAVFHHLPSQKLREEIAKELYRVTIPGGYAVVTVWDLWQKKYRKKIWKSWIEKSLGKSNLEWNDIAITFTDNSGRIFNRFHHVFTKRSLTHLFEKAGFKKIMIRKVSGNIVFVGEKQK